MIDWHAATLAELGEQLEALAIRQRAAFPETAATYAAEQRAPDDDDQTEDMG